MNKITPRKLRDLDASIPKGTECYLCQAVRNALSKYRNGYETNVFLDRNQALTVLAKKLDRGLKRFLRKDMEIAVTAYRKGIADSTIS